jgi:hypothetical protein
VGVLLQWVKELREKGPDAWWTRSSFRLLIGYDLVVFKLVAVHPISVVKKRMYGCQPNTARIAAFRSTGIDGEFYRLQP